VTQLKGLLNFSYFNYYKIAEFLAGYEYEFFNLYNINVITIIYEMGAF